MRYKTWQKVLVIVAPFAVLGALALIARFVLANVTFPPCISLTYLHFYCPGCGSTRAVRALLEGNLLLALRQNLSVPAVGFVALLYYIEFALKIWGVRDPKGRPGRTPPSQCGSTRACSSPRSRL